MVCSIDGIATGDQVRISAVNPPGAVHAEGLFGAGREAQVDVVPVAVRQTDQALIASTKPRGDDFPCLRVWVGSAKGRMLSNRPWMAAAPAGMD